MPFYKGGEVLEGIKQYGNFIIASITGWLLWLFGAWDITLQVLVALIIADYITGLMVGYSTKNLNSKIGVKGLFKKAGILICVIVAVMADKVVGTDNTLRFAIILCFCGNEGISILENVTKLGVPIPQKLLDALLQLKGNGGAKDADTEKTINNK